MTVRPSLFERIVASPRREPDAETTALLDIPAFLRRGTKENEAALALGAELLAARPSERLTRKPPDPRDQDPTKAQESVLAKLGWSSSQVRRISRADADFMIERKFGPEVRFASKSHRFPLEEHEDDVSGSKRPAKETAS